MAEEGIAEEEYETSIDVYMEMANNYMDIYHDYHIAAYLYKKCITLAQLAEDKNKEALAEMGFAKCHDLFDRSDAAINNLEHAKAKATDQETVSKVSEELIAIYRKLAEKYLVEAKGYDFNAQKALDNYRKCIDVCTDSG